MKLSTASAIPPTGGSGNEASAPLTESESELAERALIVAVAGQDKEAFRQLYQRYHLRLYGFLMRLTKQPELAEEGLNDVMLVVWQKASTYNSQSRVSTWILGIAYRKGLKMLAQRKRRSSIVVVDQDEFANLLDMDPESDQEELWDWLEKGLRQLSPEHRMVVELTHFLGHSYAEIAAISECPVSTVKTRMFYARRQLRSILFTLAGQSGEPLECSHESN